MRLESQTVANTANASGRSPSDYIAALQRHTRPMTVVFVSSLVATILIAVFWPPTYRSTGTILIEQQEIPTDFVRAAVSSYADQRVQTISQRVMTSSNLLAIINKFNLYVSERARKPREIVIQRMREDIGLEMISADVVDPRQGRATKATIAFSVSYKNRSPALAAQVANEITSLYLSENLESRQRLAAGSATFLNDEANKLGARVAELDKQIATFKEQHGDSLPEYTQLNMQLMNRTEDEMRDVDARIRSLDQQIVFLDSQLTQIDPASQLYSDSGTRILSSSDRLKVLRTQFASAKAVYGPTHPDVVRMEQEIRGLEADTNGADSTGDLRRQLTDYRAQLAAARERYAPSHPDIQRLEQLVNGTEQELARVPAPADTPAAGAKSAAPDNPAYIQIQTQREASIGERASLQTKKQQLQARIRDFEQHFAQTPGIERDYSTMLRDLQNEQTKYAEVRQKQMEAQLASNLETESKGERFQLIEPPLEPQQPTSPNRILILVLGLVLSIAAALGAVLGLEAIDTRMHGRSDIVSLLNVPPLAIIPWADSDTDKAARRRTHRRIIAVAAGCVVVAVVLVHVLVRPLDVLWYAAIRRMG